jgi:GTP-binding protein YchF
VPDSRLDELARLVKPEKVVPTTMEFVDIAGLVAGAAQGEGLGNQFLAHVRETDAIAMVVRCFEDENVHHVAGRIDPVSDVETIATELALADLETVNKALQRQERAAKSGDKQAQSMRDLLHAVGEGLNAGTPVRALDLEDEDRHKLKEYHLLTIKPLMYIANVAEGGFGTNSQLQAVEELAAKEKAEVVTVCAAIEAELAALDEDDRAEMLTAYGLDEPGLNRVIRAGYRLLGLQTFFTAGPQEVRAWTVPCGSTAPQAAGKIHSDMQRGFIRAEVIDFAEFVSCGGEQSAKEAGKMRLEGKEYQLSEGDVIHFRFNV